MRGVMTIDDLQDRLDGVYDLNQIDDSRKVIEILLRSSSQNEQVGQQLHDRLKMLALMVINGNPEAKEKAREALAVSGNPKKDVMEFLMNMSRTMNLASTMSMKQLVSEVTDLIWASLDMSSREAAILGELLYRAKKLIEIKNSPEDCSPSPCRTMTPEEYARDFSSFPPHRAVVAMAVNDEPASAEVSVLLQPNS